MSLKSNPARRDPLAKHLAIGLILATIIYVVAFAFFQHWRTRRGAWQVTFSTDEAGKPALRVAESKLAITDVRFTFPGQRTLPTNFSSTVLFDQPITNVPFGRVVYLDTTFLPGAIVFDMFGHQIQLLPRVLILEGHEVPWRSGQTFELTVTNASPTPGLSNLGTRLRAEPQR